MSGRLFVDFEFCQTAEPLLNLVCASVLVDGKTHRWWLHNEPLEQRDLADFLLSHKDKTFYSWSVEAEARSLISLGLDPLQFKWVDLYLEYRQMQNHNHKLLHGKQLIDGKVVMTTPYGQKGKQNLAAATYKLLDKIIDTEHKTAMRNLIISNPEEFTPEQQEAIMAYCDSDTVNLPDILKALNHWWNLLIPKKFHKTIGQDARLRGEYAARVAKMSALGYPVNLEWLHNFSGNVTAVMEEAIRDINRQFNPPPFRYNKPAKRFSLHEKVVKEWIEKHHGNEWEKTKGGGLSLSLDAFTAKYSYAHEYPEGNMAAQMIRYLKLKQAMNGFNPNAEKTIFHDLGSDGRIRPYHNPYGAQSSRTQPGSTSFIFLKPAWMRSMVQPRPGKAIGDYDYSSEEFLLSALCSKDAKMLAAYKSGDVYLAFGKEIGWIPKDGTKETHKFERDVCKSLVLGLSYLMTKYGLARKLTIDTGKEFTEDEAQELVEQFEETYQDFSDWRKEMIEEYKVNGFIRLPCVAEGTVVITSSGPKKVEDVLEEDLVWDGMTWARHGGAVLRGEKDVIHSQRMNLSATPDHWILSNGVWKTVVEVEEEGYRPRTSDKYLGDGRLLAQNFCWGVEGITFVAAYAALKKVLESNPYKLEKLEPVLTALNLYVPKGLNPTDTATYLMTNIFGENGEAVTLMQKQGVRIPIILSSRGMVLGAYNSASTPFGTSWNTLLSWMGIGLGPVLWTELITMGTMSVETYESLATQKTTRTRVYDIVNCGPHHRFQAGDVISHNCGWMMFGDNDNERSVGNMPIQGLGATIMRKAVALAQDAGLDVIFTLHDAIYIEYDAFDFAALDTLKRCMLEAFTFFFEGPMKEAAKMIRVDPNTWSPDYEDGTTITTPAGDKVPCQKVFVDPRAKKEYALYSKYMMEPLGEELL